jgi:hypothetical protein
LLYVFLPPRTCGSMCSMRPMDEASDYWVDYTPFFLALSNAMNSESPAAAWTSGSSFLFLRASALRASVAALASRASRALRRFPHARGERFRDELFFQHFETLRSYHRIYRVNFEKHVCTCSLELLSYRLSSTSWFRKLFWRTGSERRFRRWVWSHFRLRVVNFSHNTRFIAKSVHRL